MQLRGALRPVKCTTCRRKLWFFHRKAENNNGLVICNNCFETWRTNEIRTKQYLKEEPILEKETIKGTEETDIESEPSIVEEYTPKTLFVEDDKPKENDIEIESVDETNDIDIKVLREKNREIDRFINDVERQKTRDLVRRKH